LPPEEKLRFDMSGGKKGGFIVSSHLQVSFSTHFLQSPILDCWTVLSYVAFFFFHIFSDKGSWSWYNIFNQAK
jgi:TRAP-type C4-dicarboxylate transport system permease small subunit